MHPFLQEHFTNSKIADGAGKFIHGVGVMLPSVSTHQPLPLRSGILGMADVYDLSLIVVKFARCR